MNNRLNIVNKKRKRRSIYNFFIVVVMLGLLICGIFIIKNALSNKNSSESDGEEITTTTTTTMEVTTIEIPDEEVDGAYFTNFVYNYKLSNDKYYLYVCNQESHARLRNYTVYHNNKVIGRGETIRGAEIDKSAVDLTRAPGLYIEVKNKKYPIKYDSLCN